MNKNIENELTENELKKVNGGQLTQNGQDELSENVLNHSSKERERGITINPAHVEYTTENRH